MMFNDLRKGIILISVMALFAIAIPIICLSSDGTSSTDPTGTVIALNRVIKSNEFQNSFLSSRFCDHCGIEKFQSSVHYPHQVFIFLMLFCFLQIRRNVENCRFIAVVVSYQ